MSQVNSLFKGDCLILMQKIEDKSIDCILTDLPYGQTARNPWDTVIPFAPMWEQFERIIKENGAILLFANGMFTAKLMMSNQKLWRYNLIWEKTQPSGFLNAKRMPLRAHEDICVFYKKLPCYHPQKTTGHARKISAATHKKNSKKSLDYHDYTYIDYMIFTDNLHPLMAEDLSSIMKPGVVFVDSTYKYVLSEERVPEIYEYLIELMNNQYSEYSTIEGLVADITRARRIYYSSMTLDDIERDTGISYPRLDESWS